MGDARAVAALAWDGFAAPLRDVERRGADAHAPTAQPTMTGPARTASIRSR
jgi:hypothetical protein